MEENDWLSEQFDGSRPRLQAVAYRMLGSREEAEDAVQESWIRLQRGDSSDVENLQGWLTTIVARVCLDRLRARRARPEDPARAPMPEGPERTDDDLGPAEQALLAESVGSALLVVLDLLAPAERVAFVLHDVFAVPFDEIGPIIGRSTEAARQVASRARRRVQGASGVTVDLTRHREVIDAFVAASKRGDFRALVALLDPDVTYRPDAAAVGMGAPSERRGAAAVASELVGRAQGARPALAGGLPALAWAPGGRVRGVFAFIIADGRIFDIEVITDPERINEQDVVLLDA
jgi:RNA polymerase sigma factor (sigma-70 family)